MGIVVDLQNRTRSTRVGVWIVVDVENEELMAAFTSQWPQVASEAPLDDRVRPVVRQLLEPVLTIAGARVVRVSSEIIE